MMWRWMIVTMGLFFHINTQAQKYWDGGAGTREWSDAANWQPDGVPLAADQVILNHQWISGAYEVRLPSGNSTITIQSLDISPSQGLILLELPVTNTGNPGLSVTGTGEAVIIRSDGIFKNASGASAGSGLLVAGTMAIFNGARYIHHTSRSNAGLIDKLSTQPGTEKGIFEYDVPGTAGYTVSLTGNNFGSLFFRSTAAGASKSYSGSGSGTLTVRGDLLIDTGAQLTSTLTADLVLAGNLTVHGRLNLQPVTTGTISRSLRFVGPEALISGSGLISFGIHFRMLEIARNAGVSLARNISFTDASHQMICRGSLKTAGYHVDGAGAFQLTDSAQLFISHPEGLSATLDQGPVRTTIRFFSVQAAYIFEGAAAQFTGDGLPDTVAALGINNSNGLSLRKKVYVRDSLLLLQGNVHSTLPYLLTLGPCKVHSPASRYGLGNEGHEQSFIDGPVGLHLKQDVSYIIPIGRDTIFAPLRLLKTSPGDELRVISYVPEAHPLPLVQPPLIRVSTREHWVLDDDLLSSVKLDLSLRPWSLDPGPTELAVAAHWATQWNHLRGSAPANGYRWINSVDTITASLAFSPGLLDQATLLPLRFRQFGAREEMNGILLNWEVEEDQKEIRYQVLRSSDGQGFQEIGTLSSRGKASARHSWKDLSPLPLAYYKVRMMGSSPEITTKTIRKIWSPGSAIIYPNPVTEILNINFSFSSSTYELEIVSLNGTVCKKFVCNTAIRQVRVSDLKRGFYLLRLKDGTDWITLPFTKD